MVGGDTNPLWQYSEFGYMGSESIDKWRAKPAGVECKDGQCGLPDEPGEYDK